MSPFLSVLSSSILHVPLPVSPVQQYLTCPPCPYYLTWSPLSVLSSATLHVPPCMSVLSPGLLYICPAPLLLCAVFQNLKNVVDGSLLINDVKMPHPTDSPSPPLHIFPHPPPSTHIPSPPPGTHRFPHYLPDFTFFSYSILCSDMRDTICQLL